MKAADETKIAKEKARKVEQEKERKRVAKVKADKEASEKAAADKV